MVADVALRGQDKRGPGADPQAWLTEVLSRIVDHKFTRLDELFPWRYAAAAA